jgi:hypothetical protein
MEKGCRRAGSRTVLLKIIIEQKGVVLSQSVAEIEEDEDLSAAIKVAIDKVRAEDRSKPLWGLVIKVDNTNPREG